MRQHVSLQFFLRAKKQKKRFSGGGKLTLKRTLEQKKSDLWSGKVWQRQICSWFLVCNLFLFCSFLFWVWTRRGGQSVELIFVWHFAYISPPIWFHIYRFISIFLQFYLKRAGTLFESFVNKQARKPKGSYFKKIDLQIQIFIYNSISINLCF